MSYEVIDRMTGNRLTCGPSGVAGAVATLVGDYPNSHMAGIDLQVALKNGTFCGDIKEYLDLEVVRVDAVLGLS